MIGCISSSSSKLTFLNRAAVIIEGDTKSGGAIAKPWRLCTVQQLEDLKSLIKIFPLWSSGIFLSVQLVIQSSMAVLQALTMDCQLGSNFQIPAGSVVIFVLLSTAIAIIVIDGLLFPVLKKFAFICLTPLQRVGIGHVLTIFSMVVSALVEAKRLKIADSHHPQNEINGIVPMSVLWLLPQLAISGIGEAFHFPGHIAFYYQEFPASLKSTSTAVCAMFIGIAFYVSNPMIDLVHKVTGWLPDNINAGRLDNMFWFCSVIGTLNFVYYLLCAILYKYRDVATVVDEVAR